MSLEVIACEGFMAVNTNKRGRSAATKGMILSLFLLQSRITMATHEGYHNVEITINKLRILFPKKTQEQFTLTNEKLLLINSSILLC